MQSDKPKRDFADFFKPYARHVSRPSIPRKRTSSFEDQSDGNPIGGGTKIARVAPQSPVRTVSFKDVTPSPESTVKRHVFPAAQSNGALPIRSPQTLKPSSKARGNGSKQQTLFETSSPPKSLKEIKKPVHPSTSFSFSDASERSQSVIQDGKVVAVLDSDDSDSDSLKSLDEILGRRNFNTQPIATDAGDMSLDSSQEDEAGNEAARIDIVSKFTKGTSIPLVGKEKLRDFYAKQRHMKFDLSVVLDDHFEDMDAVEKARQARMESDSEAEDDQKLTETDKKLLADVVKRGGEDVDDDDVKRVLSAMERTEALAGDRRFCFFDWKGMRDRRQQIKPRPFPVQAIPSNLWTENDDDDKRARAFMSGLMTELTATGHLNEQVFKWTFWECLREQRSELQEAYKRTLQAGSSSFTRLHISAHDVQEVFETLGTALDVVQTPGIISLKHRYVHEEDGQTPVHLLAALDLFQILILDLDMSALTKICSILLRLCLDDMAMTNGSVEKMVETLFELLLGHPDRDARTHVYSQFLEGGLKYIHDPVLMARFLSHLPATNDTTTTLRKSLADAFLLGDDAIQPATMTSKASLVKLNKLVNTDSRFSITHKPHASPDEYAALTALITILDVAIGSGNPPSPPAAATTPTTLTATTTASIPSPGPIHHKASREAQIKAFNASVDALADSLHSIFVSIKDTGASHMRRTESKDVIQALQYRCLYNVRIGVRKKKHVFDMIRTNTNGFANHGNSDTSAGKIVGIDGDEYRDKERARAAMDRFLNRTSSLRDSTTLQQTPTTDMQESSGDGSGADKTSMATDTMFTA